MPSHRSGNYPSTRVVFKGECIYECCFHAAGLPGTLSGYFGGLQQPSNQAVIATCHALR
nr:MAG TPA: hypothetical protein [Caudoviricetes sp.]